MKKKSLILVTWGFPYGETEQSFLRTEFNRLAETYQVTILTQETSDPILYPIPEDVRVEQYAYQKNGGAGLPRALPALIRLLARRPVLRELRNALRGCGFSLKKARLNALLSFRLRAEQLKAVLDPLIAETGAEFVYTFWCYPITLTACELKQKYPDLKVLSRFLGYDLYNERLETGWQPFRAEIAARCDRLAFSCIAGKEYFLEHWGQQWREKSLLAHVGTHGVAPVHPPADVPLVLLSCSGMVPLKRVNLIIDALALLPPSVQVRWHHIGSGPQAQALEAQAERMLSPLPHIAWKLWGQIPHSTLSEVYQEIQPNLFIILSETEGGPPAANQEAFSAGVPAIGTDVGGIPELVHDGETGFLLSADPSAEEVASAIRRFHELPAARKAAMGAAARALWENTFDANRTAGKFISFLQEI